jgi:hypothetical protein
MAEKAKTARSLVASMCTTGTDVQTPSARVIVNFNKSLLAALRPRGNKWVSYAIMMALCVPGHALDLAAIAQREVFAALRRQASRDHALARLIADLRHSAQAVHGGGPVARLFQTLQQLDWRWPDTGTLLDDWGTKISWLNVPPGCFGHMLRCTQRRSFIRRIPKTRHDLGFLSTLRQGIDTFACAWLMRTKGTMKLTKWKLGLLINYLTGGDHTQQRLHRAECTADDSPICRYCDEAEETQEHIMWYCPCWAPQRRPLEILISAPQWDALPPHTRHCGLFEEDPALLDLQAELANDPMPQPVPRPSPDTGNDEWHSYLDPDGSRWVYAATDGACTNQAHPLLARAGFGVFYYTGHRLNHSAKIHGLSQTAQRAETLALVHLVSTAECPVHFYRQPGRP